MKRRLWLPLSLLLCALLAPLLAACQKPEPPQPMLQPVTFYYRTAKTDFSAADGVIRGELRDLGNKNYTDQELFALYCAEPPQSEALVSPFSQDILLDKVSRRGSMLEIRLTRAEYSPAEFNHALACACLAKTGLALEGINKVRILVSRPGGSLEDDMILTENEILLYDNGEVPANTDVTLYYADESARYLLAEQRSVPLMPQEALPEYVLRLLLDPPENSGLRSALPVGTVIQGSSVENGICRVSFNDDFCANLPADEQAQQLAVLSVVNTLCELEGINQVQIYAAGWNPDTMGCVDLSAPWIPDIGPVGPVREELGEFAGTLCLPGQRDTRLHRLTVRSRVRGGASREEALLLALLSRPAQNGLTAPLAGVPAPRSVSVRKGVCTLNFEAGALPAEAYARDQALRAVTATLCSLPEISSVLLTEAGSPLTDAPLSPAEDWFCVPEE